MNYIELVIMMIPKYRTFVSAIQYIHHRAVSEYMQVSTTTSHKSSKRN